MNKHEYTPISYDRCAPRPEIADIQRALMMMPDDDEPTFSLNDAIRVEMWHLPRLLDDEIIVYPRADGRTQAPRHRICFVKVDPMRGDVPRSTAQIVAECPWLLS